MISPSFNKQGDPGKTRRTMPVYDPVQDAAPFMAPPEPVPVDKWLAAAENGQKAVFTAYMRKFGKRILNVRGADGLTALDRIRTVIYDIEHNRTPGETRSLDDFRSRKRELENAGGKTAAELARTKPESDHAAQRRFFFGRTGYDRS